MNKRPGIYLMTDEEFAEMKQKESKESVLSNLLDATRNDTKFTTKNIKKTKSSNSSEILNSTDESKSELSTFSDIVEKTDRIKLSNDEWSSMVDYFNVASPIDDITSSDMYSYRNSRKSDADKFDTMFAKEKSMLTDVLSDLQKRSKIVNEKIKVMSGKGTYGVSKNFAELLESANSIDSIKIVAIKSMAELKKTSTDLKLKDKKLNPVVEVQDNDSIASEFYKKIIGGGSTNFVNSSMNQYTQMQNQTPIIVGSSERNQSANQTPFNITQPIPQEYSYNDNDIEVDSTGYIANEKRNVDICIYRYEDGSMKFVALDEDGEVVKNYELPDESLLSTIHTKPLSSYAYDDYDRKYKIIDISSSVSLDDIDDDKYDSLTNDDKYSF